MESKETFNYIYSAKQQEEIKQIRERYVPKEEDKMQQLRRLDADVTRKSTMMSIVVGVVGALVMGLGMSMCMVWNVFIPGIIVGVVGMAGVGLAYPFFMYYIKKERERIAPEIMRLTDELMK